MPSRKSKKWQSRRKPSLGQLRRAHPASGATWNVQVVRGKMTSKCLWHACRALVLGIVLMLLGTGMATIGYYADQLSVGHEIRGNATVRVKNESRGFHLNNLSYVGPIVMGFGGFIVVAACVMTFEARDSAAKVVPARFKLSNSSRSNIRSNSSSANSARRANGIMHQSTRWDHHLGVFRTSPADPPPLPPPIDRQALTAALVHFSKTLGNSPHLSPTERRLSRCGSVPNLTSSPGGNRSSNANLVQLSPNRRQFILDASTNNNKSQHHRHHHNSMHYHHHNPQQTTRHHHHHHHNHHNHQQQQQQQQEGGGGYRRHSGRENRNGDIGHTGNTGGGSGGGGGRSLSKSRNARISSSLVNRASRDSNNSLLHPGTLHKLHRHALSVDETGPYFRTTTITDDHGSLTSVILFDSHEARVRDRTRRSDTAQKHVLARQQPIEKEEQHQSPNLNERRRSSTTSDASYGSRYRRTSSTSRTPSIDSRSVQVELHSPERNRSSPRSPRRFHSMQSSTPSVEREFRSQLSVCSEPSSTVVRQLSGQSSFEPCVLEESPEIEEKDSIQPQLQSICNLEHDDNHHHSLTCTSSSPPLPLASNNQYPKIESKKLRPETLALILNPMATNHQFKSNKLIETEKLLLHRNTTISRSFYRSKNKPSNIEYLHTNNNQHFNMKKSSARANGSDILTGGTGANSSTQNIHNINNDDTELYDSVQVINERRGKLLKTESESALQKSNETDANHQLLQNSNFVISPFQFNEFDKLKTDFSTETSNEIVNKNVSKNATVRNNSPTDGATTKNASKLTFKEDHVILDIQTDTSDKLNLNTTTTTSSNNDNLKETTNSQLSLAASASASLEESLMQQNTNQIIIDMTEIKDTTAEIQ